MITEEQTEILIERLTNRIQKANVYFLKNIGATIKKIRSLKPTEAQQLVQILKYGGNYDDIVRKIKKYTDLTIQDIDNIFEAYAKKNHEFYKQFYQYRDIPFVPYSQNAALQTQTMALANLVKRQIYDITRANVLGYTITDENGKVLFKGLKDTYNELLDTALVNVGTGKETFDNAVRRILKDIGESGLKTIDYASGRSVRLDSALRMNLQSGLRELHNENQIIAGEEFGYDGVEISVHAFPAIDHEKAQGHQFSIKEFDKLNSGLEATDYKGTKITLDHDGKNGYRPISEMNCYHYIFSIVLGVSKPEYSQKELNKIIEDNNKGFDIDGKHYTLYEGTQLQRNLERKIREQKDTQILAKESNNSALLSESQQKITQYTQKYKELSKASGLKPKMERMRVSGYRRTNVKNVGKANYYDDTSNFLNLIDTSKKATIKNAKSVTIDGKEYFVNKQNPIIHEFNEVPIAKYIKANLHKNVEYLPNIGEDQGVKTGDFLIDGKEIWELKTIQGAGKNTIDDALRYGSKQSNIVMLDLTYSKYTMGDALKKAENSFKRRNLSKLIIKKDEYIVKVLKKES